MAWVNSSGMPIVFAASAALALASPLHADVKAGVDAWSAGQYDAAVREWRAPAERGDADALFNLAQAYKLGRGVDADLAKAEELFGKAAAKGHIQASDNYGLLLFQRGERQRALPYLEAASSRGDARAQYLLGIAHFNGDAVAKDWVRAYALVTLAQQAGLPQAAPALKQMDTYIPLEQRQQSVPVAARIRDEAQAARSRQLASADLGVTGGAMLEPGPAPSPGRAPEIVSAENAVAAAARAAGSDGPKTAGADYARPKLPEPTPPARPSAVASAPAPAGTPSAPAAKAKGSGPAAQAEGGAWRVQLGAFGVAANADGLWNRVKTRPELAGHGKLLVPAGKVTKLQAGGFASEASARAACTRLTAAGFACLAVRN